MFRTLRPLFIAAVGVLLCSLAFAQTQTGSIEGVVSDPQGNVVAGANVSVTETATGRVITVTSNDQGFFNVRSLQPGVYGIKIEKQGFSAANTDNVVVQVGQIARADIALQVGAPSETVQVDIGSTDVQVDTTRQTVDGVINARQIVQLPLNARNFLDLAALQPGVTVVDGGVIDPTKTNAYRAVRVNGGSGTGTRVALEGIDVTDENVGSTVTNFSTDAVQEFNLARSSFDLSTSLTTSGAVTVATRSGGNKFSGSGFYFKQDDKFDARPGFAEEKPEFNRAQFGYRFGGPIIKDRIFFFSNFEKLDQADYSELDVEDFGTAFDAVSVLPIEARYALNRVDGVVSDTIKLFYLHNFSDDSSTGGTLRSPYQTVNWTNTHVIGANISSNSNFAHSIRLGYVNFNNRIQSQELADFPFPVVGGQPVQINVGDLSIGPNSLAPQQTYQDNYQVKYDGSALWRNHTFRFGVDATRMILGGFANFAGPTQVTGDLTTPGATQDPLTYNLLSFQVGPNAGFFTPTPAHNLPFGGRKGTRWAWFVGDQWRIRPNLSLNLGVRWNYDTAFFAGKGLGRLAELDRYGAGLGDYPKFPKNAFSPQVGFAWDPFNDGKTSIRGGFSLVYDNNIFNNSLFDAQARMAPGIAPTGFAESGVFGPDGSPIVVNGIPGCDPADTAQGDYSCLVGRTIGQALPYVVQVNQALQAAYANFTNFDPNAPPNEFTLLHGEGEVVYSGDYKIPYSMHFNLGFQRELFRGHVISVDYVRQRGVRTPIQLFDLEHRRDARYFNEAAARTSIGNRIGVAPGAVNPAAIATYLTANPSASISTFALANDTIWPGVSPDLVNARVNLGGFSLYQGLQISMNGRIGKGLFDHLDIAGKSVFSDLQYTVGYALSSNESTSGIGRPEFLASASNNLDLNADFGPSALHRRHNLTVSASVGIIGGFRLDQIYRFSTAAPQNLRIPNNRGQSGIFTVDFNGDGGNGTAPRTDLLPGTNIGDFGTRIGSWDELNAVLTNYNNTYAGQLTPHGQRLVAAGIFSEAQLKAIGATMPFIPLVPTSNPWPFQNLFTADYRLTRPIKIWKEGWILEPSFSVFNVFNNAAKGAYAGLAIPNVGSTQITNFGALNYNYDASELGDLDRTRGLRQNRRQLQFGIRFSF